MEKLVGGIDACARVQQGDRTAWLPRFAGRGASRPSADPQSQAPAEKLLFPFFFRRGSSRSDDFYPPILPYSFTDRCALIALARSFFFLPFFLLSFYFFVLFENRKTCVVNGRHLNVCVLSCNVQSC